MGDTTYALIDIKEFSLKSDIVSYIYYFIVQSTWTVNNMKVSNSFAIGNISDPNYVAYINGSVAITRDINIYGNASVLGNTEVNDITVFGDMTTLGSISIVDANMSSLTTSYMNVSGNLNVDGATTLYNLSVKNNAYVLGNTQLKSVYIDGDMSVTGRIVLNGATIYAETNLSKLLVQGEVNILGQTNLRSLYAANDIRIAGNSFLNTTYISNGANIFGQANISSLHIDNSLVVSGSTNLRNTNISGTLNVSSVIANNITVTNLSVNERVKLNNGVDINNDTLVVNHGLIVYQSNNYAGSGSGSGTYTAVFKGTLFADRIVCEDIKAQDTNVQPNALRNAAMSVYSEFDVYDPFTYYFLIGFNTPQDTINTISTITPITFNCYAEGTFLYGIGNFGNSTFDLSANSAHSGITYNGPINIGQTTTNPFNVYASSIRFGGGDVTIDNNILIGGNITSTSDKRLKENITVLDSCMTKIKHIRGYSFTRNDLEDKNKKYLGLLAQEVEEEFPDLVSEINGVKSINYQSFVAVLLECIKELNDKLENKILS